MSILQAPISSDWTVKETEISAQATIEFTLTPKLSIKLPTAPRWIGKLMKTSLFSPLKKLFNKGTYRIKRKLHVLMIGLLSYSMDSAWPFICCQLKQNYDRN